MDFPSIIILAVVIVAVVAVAVYMIKRRKGGGCSCGGSCGSCGMDCSKRK